MRDPVFVFAAYLVAAWLGPLVLSGSVAIEAVQAAFGAAAVGALLLRVRKDRKGVGLRIDNLPRSLLVFLVAFGFLSSPVIAAVGIGPFSASEVASYFLWASFQQFVVVAGFWRPFRGTLGPFGPFGKEVAAAVLAAGVFALAHAPNLPLMGLVFVAEGLWLVLFSRFRNLFSLALAHALAALVAGHALVPDWLPSMKVGLQYWP